MLTTSVKPDNTLVIDIEPAKKPFPWGVFVLELVLFTFLSLIWETLWLPILIIAGFVGWHFYKASERETQKIEVGTGACSNGTQGFYGPFKIDIVNAINRPEYLELRTNSNMAVELHSELTHLEV